MSVGSEDSKSEVRIRNLWARGQVEKRPAMQILMHYKCTISNVWSIVRETEVYPKDGCLYVKTGDCADHFCYNIKLRAEMFVKGMRYPVNL